MVALIAILTSCKKDVVTSPYYVGESYGGGIIFYIDSTNNHGLIAAPIDQNDSCPAFANVSIFNNKWDTTHYAYYYCNKYNGGNYSDWVLPSKEQLILMYVNKEKIGGFKNINYWACTVFVKEFSSYAINFSNGNINTLSDFNSYCGVRAIRNF